ncbi:RNA polymerase sigma factor SigZ [Thalassotalea euphylliae]|uniref:RNA polymerase sigma factor SigZ n=1 Tax=Thalassotalea euphylliae TaxID=1655234 RepID=A0A3E0UJH5_9GAMM|nr:RNA polymerase sigma factor SigZ [Thalassotalea euphylliae]REL37158.1 RNA polymerase sigma factor SigZ [Thalassotalea euphylliae]
MKLEVIWQQYKSSLKAFLLSRVANVDDVEDLLQEILIKVHAKLPELKDKSRIKPWLFQITNRTIIDFYRKQRNRDLSAQDLWYENSPPDVKEELSKCIAPFINALPRETAELLTVIELSEHSQKQYAEQLGISYSTLKSRVQKGRMLLKTLFDDCCHFELDKKGNLIEFIEKPTNCLRCD